MSKLAILDLDSDLLPLGTTPLHVAANNRDTEAVSLLLAHHQWQQDFNVDQVDRHGRTPLCVALQNGRMEVARLLIEAGADLKAGITGVGQETAEVLALPGYQPLLMSLVATELPIDPAHVLLSMVGEDSLKKLLGAVLLSAAYEGNDELLKRLLSDYSIAVDVVDHMSRTPLHYASLAGHTSTACVLLEYGAAVVCQDSSGSTPLHLACTRGDVSMLEALLCERVCPNPDLVLNFQDNRLRTCSHIALYRKMFDALEYLLANFQRSLDTSLKDDDGHSLPGLLFYSRFKLDSIPPNVSFQLPLLSVEEAMWALHCAVHDGDLSAANHSLSLLSPAQVDTFDYMQYTPLMLASTLGHLEIAKALLRAGANPNIANPIGRTALICACENSCFDVANYLLSCADASPTSFFDFFLQPLSLDLLRFLFDYFHSNASAQKPAHWQKWLSLAARNREIGQREFSQLVRQICPWDWLQVLVGGKHEYCSPPPPQSTHLHYLPVYVEEKSTDCQQYREARRNLWFKVRSAPSMNGARKAVKGFTGPTRPTPSMAFQNLSAPRHSVKNNSESRLGREKTLVYSPLREAAISGNRDVVEFILSEAHQSSPVLKTRLLFEPSSTNSSQTVVEVMAKSFSSFEDLFDSWLVNQLKKNTEEFGAILPRGVSHELALIHYVLVTASTCYQVASRCSVTPMGKW